MRACPSKVVGPRRIYLPGEQVTLHPSQGGRFDTVNAQVLGMSGGLLRLRALQDYHLSLNHCLVKHEEELEVTEDEVFSFSSPT